MIHQSKNPKSATVHPFFSQKVESKVGRLGVLRPWCPWAMWASRSISSSAPCVTPCDWLSPRTGWTSGGSKRLVVEFLEQNSQFSGSDVSFFRSLWLTWSLFGSLPASTKSASRTQISWTFKKHWDATVDINLKSMITLYSIGDMLIPQIQPTDNKKLRCRVLLSSSISIGKMFSAKFWCIVNKEAMCCFPKVILMGKNTNRKRQSHFQTWGKTPIENDVECLVLLAVQHARTQWTSRSSGVLPVGDKTEVWKCPSRILWFSPLKFRHFRLNHVENRYLSRNCFDFLVISETHPISNQTFCLEGKHFFNFRVCFPGFVFTNHIVFQLMAWEFSTKCCQSVIVAGRQI